MALDLEHFKKLRPWLYHLTSRENIGFIRHGMTLKPANMLYRESGEHEFIGTHRKVHRPLRSGKKIRDQYPLRAGNISFTNGWALKDLIFHLDDHVFFWPGWESGPISAGRNHFERYAAENPIVLRVPTSALIAANAAVVPLFCKYNSGAPRCSYGHGSPRGPDTFLPAALFPFSSTDVKEVTFRSAVALPPVTQIVAYPANNWMLLSEFQIDGPQS